MESVTAVPVIINGVFSCILPIPGPFSCSPLPAYPKLSNCCASGGYNPHAGIGAPGASNLRHGDPFRNRPSRPFQAISPTRFLSGLRMARPIPKMRIPKTYLNTNITKGRIIDFLVFFS
jgi:hypothetical protein